MKDSKYGFGANPPYSLYQSDDGLWGLIDASGNKLEPVFKRGEKNCYSCVPWEVVTYNPKEGFELLSWYDPCEVWFNFTFDNPDYPAQYGNYLWKKSEKNVRECAKTLYGSISAENHWLIECILKHHEIEELDDDEFNLSITTMLSAHPELLNPALTCALLDPVMRNKNIVEDIKIALWREKVFLDYSIISYKEDCEGKLSPSIEEARKIGHEMIKKIYREE